MDLKKQLDQIHQWFQSDFDNHMQNQYEKELEKSGGTEVIHDWFYTRHRGVIAPKVGTHLALFKHVNRVSGIVAKKRLYSFRINSETECIETIIYKLNDESVFDGLEQKDEPLVLDLDPNEDAEIIDLRLVWKYIPEKHHFQGNVLGGSSQIQSKQFPGKTIIISLDCIVGPNYMWALEIGTDVEGKRMFNQNVNDHYKYISCTQYKGGVLFGGETHEILINNQGGVAKIGDTCSVMLSQSILLGSKATVLRLSVYREGDDEPIGMAICDPDSSVIGGVFAGGIKIHLEKQN